MSAIGSIVQELVAAGMGGEAIKRVLDHMTDHVDEMLALVRPAEPAGVSKAAERTRRWREKQKASQNVTRDVTGDVSGDATPSPPDGPLSLPQTPTHTPLNPPTPSAPRRDRGCALPPSWLPSQKHWVLASQLGKTADWMRQQAEAMREWAEANRNRAVARKADWDLTFSGWLRREAGKSLTRGPPAGGRVTNSDLARGFAERLRAKQDGQHHDDQENWSPGAGLFGGRGDDPPLFERGGMDRSGRGPILDLSPTRSDRR